MASIEIHNEPSGIVPRLVSQMLLIVFGAALVVSAFGVWLMPTAGGLPEVTLLKIGISAGTMLGGLCCIVFAQEARRRR